MILQSPSGFRGYAPNPPSPFSWNRKALIAMAHLRRGVHGKGVSLIEADMPLGTPMRGEAGLKKKQVLSMGSPGAHNGLFGLAPEQPGT